jgi:hypothetical protein
MLALRFFEARDVGAEHGFERGDARDMVVKPIKDGLKNRFNRGPELT